jgi:tetratricopeptide (TPR) repeat protein
MDSVISIKEEMEHTHDQETLLKLNNELNLKIKRLEKLRIYSEDIHETFKTIPFKSERLQQAEEYFYQGKFLEMDEVLDAAKIHAEIERLDENFLSQDEELKKKTYIRYECKSYELLIKALYHYTLVDNPKWYEDVYGFLTDAHEVSSNTHTLYELAAYLKMTNEQEWARELADDASLLAEYLDEEACNLYKAKSFHVMGNLSVNKKDSKGASEYFGKALTKYTELSEINPAEYRPKMSNMLVLLGDFNASSQNYSVALVVYEEAVNIRREIALTDWEYAMNLAETLDKLGSVHLCMGEYDNAILRYEEAIQIKEDNIEQNLYMVMESKANTIYNIALTYYTMEEYAKAIRVAKEELDIRKRIQEVDPFGQLPLRARTRSLIGDAYLCLNKPKEAIRERENAMKAYKILTERFPNNEDYAINLGEALNLCANIYYRMKSYAKYIHATQEAVDVFRKLAIVNPQEYLPTVSCILGNVCHFYESVVPNKQKLIENAKEAYSILSLLARDETMDLVYTNVKRILFQLKIEN